jgi:hypothetical protein
VIVEGVPVSEEKRCRGLRQAVKDPFWKRGQATANIEVFGSCHPGVHTSTCALVYVCVY